MGFLQGDRRSNGLVSDRKWIVVLDMTGIEIVGRKGKLCFLVSLAFKAGKRREELGRADEPLFNNTCESYKTRKMKNEIGLNIREQSPCQGNVKASTCMNQGHRNDPLLNERQLGRKTAKQNTQANSTCP